MQRHYSIKIAMSVGLLACLQNAPLSLAADAPKYDTPAAVVAAAEEAYGKGDYKAYADCFDPAGQKLMNEGLVQLLVVYAGLTPDGHGKEAKAVLAKYGITDLTKHGDEEDDHFAERLAGQLKDPAGFMAEASPIATPNPDHTMPVRGKLQDLTIDGAKATATYAVKPMKRVLTQGVTFVQTNGSWKISSNLDFAPPILSGGG